MNTNLLLAFVTVLSSSHALAATPYSISAGHVPAGSPILISSTPQTRPSTINQCLSSSLGQIETLEGLGTSYDTQSFCQEGKFSLTCQPKSKGGGVILAGFPQDAFACSSHVTRDGKVFALPCKIEKTECSETKKRSVILVILDDSDSMDNSNASNLRGKACEKFVRTLGTDDKVVISRFGNSVSSGYKTLNILADFDASRDASAKACQNLASEGNTPLYQSVQEGLNLVMNKAQQNFPGSAYSMLLLSDGQPSSDNLKASTKELAIAKAIPIFTVGLGPAAGDNPTAVNVLQELSEVSKGSYVSAKNPVELEEVFLNIASQSTKGRCRLSAKIDLDVGEVRANEDLEGFVFAAGVKERFSFKVPKATELGTVSSHCQD